GFAGLGVIFWMIHRLGPSQIGTILHRVGWGFFLMMLAYGMHYVFEAAAWWLILHEEGQKIGFFRLLKNVMMGESLNYITVTKMGGEAFKAYSIKNRIPLATSAASVIVLKFCTLLGFWCLITLGFLSMLFQSDV